MYIFVSFQRSIPTFSSPVPLLLSNLYLQPTYDDGHRSQTHIWAYLSTFDWLYSGGSQGPSRNGAGDKLIINSAAHSFDLGDIAKALAIIVIGEEMKKGRDSIFVGLDWTGTKCASPVSVDSVLRQAV